MDPLRRALHLARRAEKLAKVKRGSLSVIVDKRSGPPTEVTGPWDSLDRRLEDYTRMHKRDQVPDGAAYELRELARLTERAEGEERKTLEKLVRSEAARILKRKQPEHGQREEIDERVLERLLQDVQEQPLNEIADELIVARLLAQALDQAHTADGWSEAMSVWLIEPLDPLIARDGRPAAVGRFETVGFPYPSMTAGAVRTRMGSEDGAFVIPKESLGDERGRS